MTGPVGKQDTTDGTNKPIETISDPQVDNLPSDDLGGVDPGAGGEGGNESAPEPKQPRLASDDRASRLDAIANRMRRKGGVPASDDYTDPKQSYGDLQVEGHTEPESEPGPEPTAKTESPGELGQEEPAPPRKFRIKVRGEERELTEDELIARAQKVESADDYLAESRRLLDEAKRGRRNASSNTEPDEGDGEPSDGGQGSNQQDDDIADLTAALEEVQLGDPREAAERVAKIIDARVKSGARAISLEDQISDDLSRTMRDYGVFAKANADLMKDKATQGAIKELLFEEYRKDLRDAGASPDEIPEDSDHLARVHRVYRVRTGRLRDTTTLLEAAKKSYQDWREGKTPATPPRDPSPEPPASRSAPNVGADGRVRVTVDRSTNRQAMPPQTPRGSTAPPALNQPAQPKTRSQTIAEMRQLRKTGKVA